MHRPAALEGFELDEILVTASGDQLQPQDGTLQPTSAGASNLVSGSVVDGTEHPSLASAEAEAALATSVPAEPIQANRGLQEDSASPLLRASGTSALPYQLNFEILI